MFGLFASPDKKARRDSVRWIEIAEQVWHNRRDQLNPAEAKELRAHTEALRGSCRQGAGANRLRAPIEALEATLRRVGGTVYPKSTLAENVDFFLVAAIVILGFRAYFGQSFEIPTNSMWPSFNGMTPEVFTRPGAEPGPLAEAGRIAAFGAWPRRLDAPASGEILIPIGGAETRGLVHYHVAPGRSWLVLPAKVREYTIFVGETPVKVRVPLDFEFDWAVYDAFFSSGQPYSPANFFAQVQRRVDTRGSEVRMVDGEAVRCVRTGRRARAGERLLAFDEMTGDKLIVDRFSYQFARPAVGSGIVFRTGHIPAVAANDGDVYFVKRLVGVPGDTLEVRDSALFRNGSPIAGSRAFQEEALRRSPYPGYEAGGSLAPGLTVRVPPTAFFGMGDNSPNSDDSRNWGFIPAKDVAGRPLFVFYPFTRRWGFAR